MGFAVLDADSLAHRLIDPGLPAYNEVLQEFGPGVVAPDGRVDRPKLSAIVFADRSRLDRLNAIVHPRVAEVVFRQFEEWQRGGTRDAAFVEAALLIESGIHKKLDGSWWPGARLNSNSSASSLAVSAKPKPARRIAAQLPVEEKLRLATEKIDCSRLYRGNPPPGRSSRHQTPPKPDGAVTRFEIFLILLGIRASEGTTAMTAVKISNRARIILAALVLIFGAYWGRRAIRPPPTHQGRSRAPRWFDLTRRDGAARCFPERR